MSPEVKYILKNMTKENAQTLLGQGAVQDIRMAHEDNKGDIMSQVTGDWIREVDPETMMKVKALYKLIGEVDGTISLYKTFCLAL